MSISSLVLRLRVPRRWWNCKEYIVYFQPLVSPPPGAGVQDGPVRFRLAAPHDIPRMSRYLGTWASWCRGGTPVDDPAEVLAEQFVGQDITVIGTADRPAGELVYLAWYSHDDFGLTLLGDAARRGREVTIRRAWVPPDRRRSGVALSGWRFAQAELIRRGVQGIWSFVRIENTASQGLHRKLGIEQRGRARILTRLGRRYGAIRLDPDDRWRTMRIPQAVTHL